MAACNGLSSAEFAASHPVSGVHPDLFVPAAFGVAALTLIGDVKTT